MRNHGEVDNLAQQTIAHFGTFDAWVNNAGLGLWGRLEEVSDEDHRQLFDINFWGIVYGSVTALRNLKQHGGALINLGSVASDFAFPMQSMYTVTKMRSLATQTHFAGSCWMRARRYHSRSFSQPRLAPHFTSTPGTTQAGQRSCHRPFTRRKTWHARSCTQRSIRSDQSTLAAQARL